jgi:hypothetical protein
MKKTGDMRRIPILILLLSGLLTAADIEFKAGVNADRIGTEDILIYTLTCKGSRSVAPPDLSYLADWRVVESSRSSEFQLINGEASYYIYFVYYLAPLRTGALVIPKAKIQINGKEYLSQSFQIEVQKGSTQPQPPQQQAGRSLFDDEFARAPSAARGEAPDVQIRARLSKKSVVLGEPLGFTVLLYTRSPLETFNMVSDRTFPGFFQEWFPLPKSISGRNESVNGKTYQVFDIQKAVLFPTHTGVQTVPALRFDIQPASSFLFFSNQPLVRSTVGQKIEVLALPVAAQGLPVGRFSFSARSDKTRIDVNDLLVLKIVITGNGNIKTVTIPELPASPLYKVFPAKTASRLEYRGDELAGSLTAEIPVSFSRSGTVTLPPLEFHTFDPDKKQIVIQKSAALTVTVTGTKEDRENAMSLPSGEIVMRGEDIDFIATGAIPDQGRHPLQTSWFRLLVSLPFFLSLLLFLKLYLWDRFLAGHIFFEKKRVLRRALERIERATDFGEISAILEEYFHLRLHLEYATMSAEEVNDILASRHILEADIRVLQDIRTRSESWRFSPQRSGATDWQRDRERIGGLIRDIDRRLS